MGIHARALANRVWNGCLPQDFSRERDPVDLPGTLVSSVNNRRCRRYVVFTPIYVCVRAPFCLGYGRGRTKRKKTLLTLPPPPPKKILVVTMCVIWILTVVEGEFAVICSCLPLLRPVLPRLFGWAMAGPSAPSQHKEETSSIMELGVMTIGGSGGGGSCGVARRSERDSEDVEIEVASCEHEIGKDGL